MQIMDPRIGLINNIITALGGQANDFFGKPELFTSIYVWSGVWQGTGFAAIIYLAALSGVSNEQQEAAIVDGASRLKRIWHVDLPCITPTIIILLIMNIGGIPVDVLASEADRELPDKNAKIIVYCKGGNRSAQAIKILSKLGYTNIYNLGGIVSWPYETVSGDK